MNNRIGVLLALDFVFVSENKFAGAVNFVVRVNVEAGANGLAANQISRRRDSYNHILIAGGDIFNRLLKFRLVNPNGSVDAAAETLSDIPRRGISQHVQIKGNFLNFAAATNDAACQNFPSTKCDVAFTNRDKSTPQILSAFLKFGVALREFFVISRQRHVKFAELFVIAFQRGIGLAEIFIRGGKIFILRVEFLISRGEIFVGAGEGFILRRQIGIFEFEALISGFEALRFGGKFVLLGFEL